MELNHPNHCTHIQDIEYDNYVGAMTLPPIPVFSTETDLWPLYIDSFHDLTERQYHNCNACRHFITRYDNLVTIDKNTGKQLQQSGIQNMHPKNTKE